MTKHAKIHIQNNVLAKFLVGSRDSDPPKKRLTIFRKGVRLFLPIINSCLLSEENFKASIVMNPRINDEAMQDL